MAATSCPRDGSFTTSKTRSRFVPARQAPLPLEPRQAPFRDLGVNVRVLWPGDANALYHHEDAQEGFLVLSGECLLIVEEQERPLRQWDYFHCPPGTRHVIVGAGKGPCVVLMIGVRPVHKKLALPGK